MASEKRDFRALRNQMSARPKRHGIWMEVMSRRVGRAYYYNRRTEISTWLKPPEWQAYDRHVAVQIARALESDDSEVQFQPSTVIQN